VIRVAQMNSEEARVIEAADLWTHAMEGMADAQEKHRDSDEMEKFERAEFALYNAVLRWRLRRH
jgi:hypothetical protein